MYNSSIFDLLVWSTKNEKCPLIWAEFLIDHLENIRDEKKRKKMIGRVVVLNEHLCPYVQPTN